MSAGKRLLRGLVFGLALFICLTTWLANPSECQPEAYSILHNFGALGDGFQPYFGHPVLSGSTLYGMTEGGTLADGTLVGGVLYKINTDGTGYAVLHYFDNRPVTGGDGTVPRGGLTLSGSTLYGCCGYTGIPYLQGNGTVFKITTDGTGYQIIHTFFKETSGQCNPIGAPVVSGSRLYGTNVSDQTLDLNGVIFAMNTDGSAFQVLHEFAGKPDDGAKPYGSLTLVGSRLYGMTRHGGRYGTESGFPGNGVIFAIDTDGSNYQILHHFAGYPTDGKNPYGSLTLVGSKLYGMTGNGGASDGPGVIFSINLDGSGYQVILDFSAVSGASGPYGSLTLWGGKLYGMTAFGGENGVSGAIFRVNPDGTGFKVLHGFMPSLGDGGGPYGDVTFAGNRLYGWTYANGANNEGVFFSLQPEPPPVNAGMLNLLLMN
jgi:uncharacterized repeat protein (TIGR03803 family)